MTEKPLHVRVAEALGWEVWETMAGWDGRTPDDAEMDNYITEPPNFDTDWSATGPLIEKYGIVIGPSAYALGITERVALIGCWAAMNAAHLISAGGETPLIAVCNLILALHEAGKLEKAA